MSLLFLTILFPLLGFLTLAISRGRFSENLVATIATGSVGIAALITLIVTYIFHYGALSQEAYAYSQSLWEWMAAGDFSVQINLYLDGLSLTMLSVVVGVGFLIHMYATWYMRGEEGYSRFFAYTNLFIASMLILVLADDLLVLYLGWEGVGLCSYLLIGFYYKDPNNGKAAMKAFLVTRLGDVFMAIGLFILYATFGTLNIAELNAMANDPYVLAKYSTELTWAALMLVGGAFGKSAQLPLQTWLADAMAGPTPVSALIHAATMVTAGVYLIARMNGLFLATPEVLYFVAIMGALTLLMAGCAALVQTDIKRVLAYSTMSQLGYMFLALGVQAWDGAIFHLVTHAFFKALLFLASGSVIIACHHEQNIFKMGGLYKKIPLVYVAFLVGGAALSALPLVTAGFYSKDEILWGAMATGHNELLIAGLVGAFMTSLYTFRMIFIVFHGEAKTDAHEVKGVTHTLPLVVLMLLSTAVGAFLKLPFAEALPQLDVGHDGKVNLEIISAVVATVGVLLAVWLYLGKNTVVQSIAESQTGKFLTCLWKSGWGFDALYDKVFVKPYLKVADCLATDPIDRFVTSASRLVVGTNRGLTLAANGHIRWYVASICIGAVIVLAALLLV